MEGNNDNNIKVELQKEDLGQPSVPLKKCNVCGKMLPLDHFAKYGHGYRATCEVCRRASKGISDRFKDFTSRELIEELKSRGYKGKLTRVITEETVL